MKVFVKIVLGFFLLMFGGVFLLQTPLIKTRAKNLLIRHAQSHGIELSIETVEGNLPFEWKLKNVHCKWKNQEITFDTLKSRFAVLPLFKKELELSHLKIRGGYFDKIPFELSLKGKMDLKKQKPIKLSHLLIQGKDLFIRLDGKLHADFSIEEGHLDFHFPNLSIFETSIKKGALVGTGTIYEDRTHFECFLENGLIEKIPLIHSSLILDAKRTSKGWNGEGKLFGGHEEIPLSGNCTFFCPKKSRTIAIEHFNIDGPEISSFGKLDLHLFQRCLEGIVFSQCRDLKVLRPLFPKNSYLSGSFGGKFDFQSYAKIQDLQCQIEIENLNLFDTVCESLTVESSISDLFGDPNGEFWLEGETFNLAEMHLKEMVIKSTFDSHASPFEFTFDGTWKDPFLLKGEGDWQRRGKGIYFNINTLQGSAFKKPFALCEPFSLDWNQSHFKMSNFSMDLGEGHLFSRIDLGPSNSFIKIQGEDFPLEFIALPHKHFSLIGTSSFEMNLVSWENHLQGNGNISLKRARLLSEDAKEGLTTKGTLQIHLNNEIAQVYADLKATEKQFVHFFGRFPILYHHYPFKIEINREKSFSSQLVAEGKLEDLFNFINIGHHKIEGWLSTKLHVSKTFDHPSLQGTFELQDGSYENYYTGTYLKEIYANANASKQNLIINHLHALDAGGGIVTASGEVLLNPLQNFPFSITAHLHQLDAISFDTIAGNFTGQVTISGNRLGAIAKGNLKVDEATFRIPDELPSSLPELPIQFINPPETITRKKILPSSQGPLELDLDLSVPGKAYVEGRGLNVELDGNLHISGTYTDIVAKGKLQLVKGEYIFSGKVFDLRQGELIFNDKPTPSAYISLSGECSLPDANVEIILRGPLTEPKLTFQSSPQMPTSSILAQILFNKDISEISAIQALQVAQTVISLSGSSAPDILEKIRKTLGIDRLTLITSENDPGKISLQIGKYLMRGVLLTLSQGPESRNVSVEVDLKKGIKFQAEVNEGQQGKFSLKWHHHY